ncbi:hypothetical protein C8J57DRAFT_1211499 [Mycena rebaudengoi]|nr:hypothetical protein C8J57DRAFT_1211499 [Mycena rebaudengoi]
MKFTSITLGIDCEKFSAVVPISTFGCLVAAGKPQWTCQNGTKRSFMQFGWAKPGGKLSRRTFKAHPSRVPPGHTAALEAAETAATFRTLMAPTSIGLAPKKAYPHAITVAAVGRISGNPVPCLKPGFSIELSSYIFWAG